MNKPGSLSPARAEVCVATAEVRADGTWVCADDALCDLLDLSFDEISRRSFDEVFPAEDAAHEREVRARLLGGAIPYYSSHRTATRADGSVIYAVVHFTRPNCKVPAIPESLQVTIVDATSLEEAESELRESENARHELARRLTNAQEKERTRIARELHDDIGQSLAILRIQMLRAGQPVSGMIGKRHPTIPQLCDQLKLLAEKVSRISHQLHSSELEYLGLAVAVQSHCREFSEKYKIPVECSCNNVPADLDNLLALSLLRIVQEALYNAGKYSKAKTIQVALEGSEGDLSLIISDDGVGFDLNEAKMAAGLGLISMRERVHLAGGEFKIDSEPGEGTCIMARVPLPTADQENTSS
jgi:PAS domain S-box-containing protein